MTYNEQDHLMFQKLKAWAKRRHPQKAIQWIINKYWKIIGGNNWVFATSAKGLPLLTKIYYRAF
ncbi:MAG: hypothetical protein LH628_20375 [Microcoleus sp. CAN_BIN18]|nr:hypothetical protein [Microcoleus sp. CAN_BIN18]